MEKHLGSNQVGTSEDYSSARVEKVNGCSDRSQRLLQLSSSSSSEKAIAAHSSVLAWRIPGMAEPGGLSSMGSHRVGHDWSDLAATAAAAVPILGFH